jgi:hypothetical protein
MDARELRIIETLPVKKKQCAHYFIDLKFTRGILVV